MLWYIVFLNRSTEGQNNMDVNNPVYSYDCQDMSLIKDKTSQRTSSERERDNNLPRQVHDNSSHTIIPTRSELKSKKTYIITIIAATFLFLLALALITVVVYTPLANNLNKEITDVMAEVQKLKLQLNLSQVKLNAEVNSLKKSQVGNRIRIHNLTDEIHVFQQSVHEKLDSLQLVVNSVNHVQHITTDGLNNVETTLDTLTSLLNMTASQLSVLHSIWASHSTAMAQLASLQTVVNGLNTVQHSTTSHVINLQSSVDGLTTRVQAPVNLFQNCTKETTSCTISTYNSYYYYRACSTPFLAINVTGLYTTDMSCEYHSSRNYLDSAVLFKSGTNVQCQCDITRPNLSSSSHSRLPSSLSGSCSLVVTRCPLSVLI